MELAAKRNVYRAHEHRVKAQLEQHLKQVTQQIQGVEAEILRRANSSIESQSRGKVELNKLRLRIEDRRRENDRLRDRIQQLQGHLMPSDC